MTRMSPDHFSFASASDESLLVRFGDTISRQNHNRVAALLRDLEQHPIVGIRNLHPAYSSLLVVFDSLLVDQLELGEALRERLARVDDGALASARTVEIPVCYDREFGFDLDDVAAACSCTTQQVIAMHCSREYTVYFLGFAPGFAYLGELPAELEVPRLATPRRVVPRGSVAIAGPQTAVYPLATPGGWRIIGRTPLAMFAAGSDATTLLRTGDQVRFLPISRRQFDSMGPA